MEVLAPRLASSGGLTSAEAAERLVRFGPNRPVEVPVPSVWQRVLRQLKDPLVVVLLLAAGLTVVTGDVSDALIISFVIVVNTAVGVQQEERAERALAALRSMSQPTARVIRDGRPLEVAAEAVVPGDRLLVAEGDVVVADGELDEAFALLVDESALTGESVPVSKQVGDGDEGLARAGTLVLRGRGSLVVTGTGTASALGQIAAGLSAPLGSTPLQRRIARLGRRLAEVAAGLCAVVLALGLARGESAELMVLTAVSLIVAAVPESLPAVITLALALGSRRMAQRHAIVRRLAAVETLGSVTMLATDKTGTLTEGRMVVERVWSAGDEAALTGIGYGREGTVLVEGREVDVDSAPGIAAVLEAAALCNDASLITEDGERRPLGDPMEAALVVAAEKVGYDVEQLRAAHPRVDELPFDTAVRAMATVHRRPQGTAVLVRKGAPEAVLGDLGSALARAALDRADQLTAEGYRVLAVTATELTEPPLNLHAAAGPPDVIGLVGLVDPPRATAAATLESLRAAGITPVLITGDHEQTAQHVARRVGITGEPSVYARTTPQEKLEIVRGWQRDGHVVAMTGDGVNDGPALRQADIGVAMGERGTEVARQAADLVLADDELASLVAAVEEGRRIYANVRRFLLYGLTGGFAEILIMLAGPFIGIPLPLLPAQILWVNLLTHGLPGVALGAEPAEPGVLRRPPRPPSESILGDGLWQRVTVLGTFVAAVSLGFGLWAKANDRPVTTMVFLSLGAAQLGVAAGVRAKHLSLANPLLLVALPVALALQLAGAMVGPLQDLLGTRAVRGTELLAVLAAVGAGYLAARLAAVARRDHRP